MSIGDWKRHLGRGPVSVSLGRVRKHEGELEYWQVNEDGDLEVQVVLDNHEVPVVALLGALVGGNGRGVWAIPAEGTEVLVTHADGFEGDAVIVGVLPTGNTPSGLDVGKVFIRGVEVVAYDNSPLLAKNLATLDDLQALRNWVAGQFSTAAGHTHSGGGSGAPVLGAGTSPSTSPPTPSGTSVFKAE